MKKKQLSHNNNDHAHIILKIKVTWVSVKTNKKLDFIASLPLL